MKVSGDCTVLYLSRMSSILLFKKNILSKFDKTMIFLQKTCWKHENIPNREKTWKTCRVACLDGINFKIYLWQSSKGMADREKKRKGRWKHKNVNISRTKRAFSMKQKAFFIIIKGLSCDGKTNEHKL